MHRHVMPSPHLHPSREQELDDLSLPVRLELDASRGLDHSTLCSVAIRGARDEVVEEGVEEVLLGWEQRGGMGTVSGRKVVLAEGKREGAHVRVTL